ncbi:methyl-accepting chemotaxis protein [Serpentinicella sp. ANB-PHB4]|uniref:methyl-accepting chemotaxis protein n=1 Tax=Serpentinicella sp. ANB-PHB4 TaxID=3074076 RepID=UPI002854C81C|nr:methyl-accepting chemotaxis protein [Serpentinicella sp. ANB-PHB4]MDR5659854.1 methyl-accepting chemotaxis protein [Serpentinicella sp. ANB-PHB4]
MLKKLKNKISLIIGIMVMIMVLISTITTGILVSDMFGDYVQNDEEQNVVSNANLLGTILQNEAEKIEIFSETDMVQTMDWDIMGDFLESQHAQNTDTYDLLFVSDTDGDFTTTGGIEGNVRDRDYFPLVMQGETVISEPVVSVSTGEVISVIATPITNEFGEIIGLMGASVNLSSFSHVIEPFRVAHEDSYSYVVSGDGTIILHPNPNLIIDENISVASNLIPEEITNASDTILNEEFGREEYVFEDTTTEVYFSTIPGTNDWKLLTRVPAEFTSAPVTAVTSRINLILLVIGIIFSIITGMGLGTWISKPIEDLSNLIHKQANFDLSFTDEDKAYKHLKRKDEIGMITKSIQNMNHNIVGLIKSISDMAKQTTHSSDQLSENSQQSSVAAEEVAKTIEEIASGASGQAQETEAGAGHINDLGVYIENNSKSVISLNEATSEVSRLKDEGVETINDLLSKTADSNKITKDIHDTIENTNESAKQIEKASQMISSIAEQTNLLALNAAIEAARAGDAGKGFAVVAEEIRTLAEQSNVFTEEINQIIGDLTNKTTFAVDKMDTMSEVVSYQTQSVEETNNKFEGISIAIEKIKNAIAEVNESKENMENKKDEIISIIENLSAISEENAAATQEASASVEEQTASIEEIATASDSLAQLAIDLQKSIDKFKY